MSLARRPARRAEIPTGRVTAASLQITAADSVAILFATAAAVNSWPIRASPGRFPLHFNQWQPFFR